MKRIIIFSILLTTAFSASSQLKGFSFGPYIEAVWPSGKFDETHHNGFGAGVNADIKLGNIGLTGSVGVLRFGGRQIETADGREKIKSLTALPLRLGLKYHLVPLLYLKLESGLANHTADDDNSFVLAPGVGVRVLGLDVQLKYETWTNSQVTRSFWGLKGGFNF